MNLANANLGQLRRPASLTAVYDIARSSIKGDRKRLYFIFGVAAIGLMSFTGALSATSLLLKHDQTDLEHKQLVDKRFSNYMKKGGYIRN